MLNKSISCPECGEELKVYGGPEMWDPYTAKCECGYSSGCYNTEEELFLELGGKKEKICATCGLDIEDNYYKIGDNFLQVKFFDDEETENIFCSKDCLCQALSVLEVDEDGEAFPV